MGLWSSMVGRTGHAQEVAGTDKGSQLIPVRYVALYSGTHGACPGSADGSRDSGTGRTVGLRSSTVGHTGQDRQRVPMGTGQVGGHLQWDTWGMSGKSQWFPGLRHGRDSGIAVLHGGTHVACPGSSDGSWDSGTGRTVGCGTFCPRHNYTV